MDLNLFSSDDTIPCDQAEETAGISESEGIARRGAFFDMETSHLASAATQRKSSIFLLT